MSDAGGQIWENRVSKDIELTPQKNRSEQEQKKNVEKKELREMDNQKEINENTMKNDLSWNDPWLRSPWNTIWAYLSFSFGTPNPGLHYVL